MELSYMQDSARSSKIICHSKSPLLPDDKKAAQSQWRFLLTP